VHAIGPEGGMVSSTVVPQVQAIFPDGALTKKIKVGLQVGSKKGPLTRLKSFFSGKKKVGESSSQLKVQEPSSISENTVNVSGKGENKLNGTSKSSNLINPHTIEEPQINLTALAINGTVTNTSSQSNGNVKKLSIEPSANASVAKKNKVALRDNTRQAYRQPNSGFMSSLAFVAVPNLDLFAKLV